MNGAMPLRIGLLMDHPSAHMASFLNALSERDDCAVSVVYCGMRAPGRRWAVPDDKLPHVFLGGVTIRGGFYINPGLFSALNRIMVDMWVINAGYTSLTTWLSVWWMNHRKVPWVFMGEAPRIRGRALSSFKNAVLRLLLMRAQGIIGTGAKAKKIFSDLVSSRIPVVSVPYYYIGLEGFLNLPIPSAPSGGETVNFVTLCQMIRRKGLDVLLDACKLLPQNGWHLTLAGDGPLRYGLEKEFLHHWGDGRVAFTGEVPYERRFSIFNGHHVFVFPSRWDGWGVVLVEAMAAGLPVISTDGVGSAHDFIIDGKNGFMTAVDNAKALAQKMIWFMRHRDEVPHMGRTSRESMDKYSPVSGGDDLIRFLSSIYADLQKPCPIRTFDLLYTNIYISTKRAFIRASLAARPRRKVNGHRILMYHFVSKVKRKQFEDQLKFLSDNFEIYPLSRLFPLSPGRLGARFKVALTFDDGFRVLMEDCLELLEKYGIKASFYVPTNFVELSGKFGRAFCPAHLFYFDRARTEFMKIEDLRLLTRLGHEIGSHGASHISVSAMSRHMIERELSVSREKISSWVGKSPQGFAYPYGETDSSIASPAELVRKAGYAYGLTATRGPIDASSDKRLLPRDHAEGSWSLHELRYFLMI